MESSKLAFIHNVFSVETIQNIHTPDLKQQNAVKSHILRLKGASLQKPEPIQNSSAKKKLGANQHRASITPRAVKTKLKTKITTSHLKCDRDDIILISEYKITLIEKDEEMIELQMTRSSTVVFISCMDLWFSETFYY